MKDTTRFGGEVSRLSQDFSDPDSCGNRQQQSGGVEVLLRYARSYCQIKHAHVNIEQSLLELHIINRLCTNYSPSVKSKIVIF